MTKGRFTRTHGMVAGGWGLLLVVVLASSCSADSTSDDEAPFLPATLEVELATIEVNGEEVGAGDQLDIDSGDHVLGDDRGVGTVRLGDAELKVVKATDMVLPDLTPEAGQPLLVELSSGHLFVDTGQAGSPIEVQTGNRRITTVDPGTRFVICQSPDGDTCVFVIEGVVDWRDNFDAVRYRTGEGAGAAPGAGPGATRCDVSGAMSPWTERVTSGADADPLIKQLENQVSPCAESEGSDDDVGTPTTTTTTTSAPQTTGEPTDGETTELPSGAGMVPVALSSYSVGNPDFSGTPGDYVAAYPVDTPISFYVDQHAVTNETYLQWVLDQAGNDSRRWHDLAPSSWLDGLAEDDYFRAEYAEGEGGEPVAGVRFDNARSFCESQDKRLVSEVEWEVAAVAGVLEDLGEGRQEWVDHSADYGPGVQPGHVVLRGTNDATGADIYFRSQVVDTPESTAVRVRAQVRCAADQVDPETAVQAVEHGGEIVYQDDFRVLELGNWPEVASSPEQLLSLDYHPVDVYHLEAIAEHVRGAVVKPISEFLDEGAGAVTDSGWRVESQIFIERDRTTPAENHRYGILLGSTEGDMLAFTVQPDEVDHDGFIWCLSEVDDELVAKLGADGMGFIQAPYGGAAHVMENCRNGIAHGDYAVPESDEPVTLALAVDAGTASFSINGDDVGSESTSLEPDHFGFFVQTFDKTRSHIHFEAVTLSRL